MLGFVFLAKKALDHETDFNLYISVHLFLVLCWNLMARAVSTAAIMFDHISWEGNIENIDSKI